MKKIYGFAALAALALTSCSNENEPNVPVAGAGEPGYLAVTIVNPATTRAISGYELGTAAENKADKATFILFKDNNVQKVLENQNLNPWEGIKDYDKTVENISTTVLLIENAGKDEAKPTSVMAVLNATTDMALASCKTLADVQAKIADYSAHNEGSFIMTNSVYNNGTANVYTTDVKDNIAKTPELAKANPADIYVERVVAKVKTSAATGEGFTHEATKVTIGGVEYDVTINVDGIEVANVAKKSYLVKNLEGITNPFTGWNDATNFRSYWAKGAALTSPALTSNTTYSGDFDNQSWTAIDATEATGAQTFYIQENTGNETNTSVLVTAHLTYNGGKNLDMVRLLADGNYYLKDDARKALAEMFKGSGFRASSKEGTNTIYDTFEPADFEWAGEYTDKGWISYLKLTATAEAKNLVKYDAAQNKYVETTADDINNTLKGKAYQVWKWTDGKCYYFVEIEHDTNLKGIVRNHIYDLNLQSIKGLGVPVFNPDRVIIPEIPTWDESTDWSLAARINVHKWAVVKQNIKFEN